MHSFLTGRVANAHSAAGRHQLFYLSPGHDVHVWSTTLTVFTRMEEDEKLIDEVAANQKEK